MIAATLKSVTLSLTFARRAETVFDLSDHQLATRGYCRDGLVRSYIAGLGLS